MLLSIIQGIFNKKKSDTALNELVWKAKSGDEKVMNDLLIAFTPFMKKTASFVWDRFIDESDEEFSVAMVGFHEAVLKYKPEENAS
ncbi:MAG TPA: RNA polymerase sigma-I factor, partial [Sporosarcina sp.]|nr:RNA polymerase sigma-I factor [Sporosarcina sp.]